MERWRHRAERLVRTLRPMPAGAAFAVAALVHGAYAAAVGVTHAGDTRVYAQAADRLIASGFDYASVVGQTQAMYPPALYVLFASVVALLKLLFGERWDVAVVVLNVLAAAGVAGLLVTAARRATGSAAAAWCAMGLFLVSFGIVIWTPVVLSDTTFFFVAFLVFALAADRVLHRERSWVPVFVLAAAAAFYRPPGVVLAPAVAWAMFLAHSRPGAARRTATAAASLAAVVGTVVFSWIMQQPSRWPVHALSGTVRETARTYSIGEVVSARPLTYHAPPVSVPEYAAVAGDRFLHFFAVTAADFSLPHNLVNALFFVPVYALAAWLLVAMLRDRDGLSQPQRDVFLAAAGFVLFTAAFHGLLQVDFDWRYRLPILPHLVLLAAGGAAVLLRRRDVRA